jgi:4-amino-4-deoxy-L-arabinose transferase-like glycosyltransferase
MTRRDWIVLLGIVLLAGGLRFYQLGVVPPGPQFDEAFNALDAELVLAGNRPLFLPANGGREVVYTYIQAAVGALFGLNLYTLRLVSAVAGILTVVALYFTVRGLFRRNGRWLAAMTALALAVSYWHIHFSHYGIRVILMPLLLCGVFGLFWLGMHGGSARTRLWAVLAAGALAGLSVWTNPTGRFTPFVAGAYVVWLLWRYPDRRRLRVDSPMGGLLLFGAAAFVVFLPLGLEFWRYPEFFLGHASEVSIFAERVTGGGSPWPLLLNNILRVLGMFSFDGDLEWAHGIPDRPVFDWFLAIPFYIGVVIWALRLVGKAQGLWAERTSAQSAQPSGRAEPAGEVQNQLKPVAGDAQNQLKPVGDDVLAARSGQVDPDRDALALFAIWAIVMLAPSVLSEAAPNYSRTLPSIPAVMLAAGLGLTYIGTLPQLRARGGFNWGLPLVGGLVAASILVTFNDYFIRYPQFREVYYLYDADKVDAVTWLEEQADAEYAVYLSPLWSTHSTVAFLRSGRIESLDATDAIVLPPAGMGAVYAWPAEQQAYAEDVAERLDVPLEVVNDKHDRPLLAVVRLTPEQAAGWPPDLAPEQIVDAAGQVREVTAEEAAAEDVTAAGGATTGDVNAPTMGARFDDAPTVLGINVRPGARDILLYWRAEQKTLRDLTSFIHLIGPDGERLGQIDKTPGDGTYHTPHWTPGDRVIQRFRPELNDVCAGGTPVQVVTGWYEYAAGNARRPRLDGAGDSVVAGTYALPFYSVPPDAVQADEARNIPLAQGGLALTGYTVRGEARAGEPLTVDLLLAGTEAHGETDLTWSLRPGEAGVTADAGAAVLWEGELAPRVAWDEGEILCRRLTAVLPEELAPGAYVLHLGTAEYAQDFGVIEVGE